MPSEKDFDIEREIIKSVEKLNYDNYQSHSFHVLAKEFNLE